jgi:hypothetical protein
MYMLNTHFNSLKHVQTVVLNTDSNKSEVYVVDLCIVLNLTRLTQVSINMKMP